MNTMNSKQFEGPNITEAIATVVSATKNDNGINTNHYFGDREPCWFATIEKADVLEEFAWRVGCTYIDHTDECSICFSDIGNVKDLELWKKINAIDFAIKLIDLFKIGGEKQIRKYIKSTL